MENPASSVFCAHGAGFLVNWELVPEYAHLESDYEPDTEELSYDGGFTMENRG